MKDINVGYSDEHNALRQRAYNLLAAKEYRRARELFEQLYDGKDSSIASCLGFIHSQSGSSEYNRDLALAYYKKAAGQGDEYSNYAVGGMLMEAGNIEEAVKWYETASKQGIAQCSYNLYLIFKRRGDKEAANQFFHRAVEQGHVVAKQQLAIKYITGRYGMRRILSGIRMYFQNLPNLARYTKERASSRY